MGGGYTIFQGGDLKSTDCTCTILVMSIGSIARGKRKRLNRERETKAVLASRMLSGEVVTYTANVAIDTCRKETLLKMITKLTV